LYTATTTLDLLGQVNLKVQRITLGCVNYITPEQTRDVLGQVQAQA